MKELAERLDYDRDTGVLTWNKGPRKGKQAGYVRTDGYRVIANGKGNSPVRAHRLIWYKLYGEFDGDIDHINRNRDDNRLCNLRVVDRTTNLHNKPSLNVYRCTKMGWQGRFGHYGQQIYVGWNMCPLLIGLDVQDKKRELGIEVITK